jgi:hypothetical protein
MVKINAAWLLTWEWDNPSDAVNDKVISIFNYKYSNGRVEQLVELIYHQTKATLLNMAAFAKHPDALPNRAKTGEHGWIRCGSNPTICARLVDDLYVYETVAGWEVIQWTERAKFTTDEEGKQVKVADAKREKYSRTVKGPLSFAKVEVE